MGDNHNDDHNDGHNDGQIHVYCFKIEGDHAPGVTRADDGPKEDWARYTDMGVYRATATDFKDPKELFQNIEGDDEVFKGKYGGNPFGAEPEGTNALDLYLSAKDGVSKIICAFNLPRSKKKDEGLVFDPNNPFELVDTGWSAPCQTTEKICTPEMPHWAAFVLDVEACRNSELYKDAVKAREFPYVRFPIIFRVTDRAIGLPASMVPNTHSAKDRNRFGNPGLLRLAEMMKNPHDHFGDGDQADLGADALFRHFGPHFAGSYSVNLRID